jgi:hypothetical protein
LITCAILFWFGNQFAASVVMGFALALAISVLVSMFTAITVTRTFLRVTQQVWLNNTAEVGRRRGRCGRGCGPVRGMANLGACPSSSRPSRPPTPTRT